MALPVRVGVTAPAVIERAVANKGTTTYEGYAEYLAQTIYANNVGAKIPGLPTGKIPDPAAGSYLGEVLLTDPVQIRAFRETVADQMNAQSGGVKFRDLSEQIADIISDGTVQGASTLEVHLIDPRLDLLTYGSATGQNFIQADENGYLWPPISINLPSGTDCWWTLVQVSGTYQPNTTQANLVLTFEDRIVSVLRRMSPVNGVAQGTANQTLSGFFQQLVDSTNHIYPGVKIRYVPLVSPQDPNYTLPVTSLPSSSQAPLHKQPLRTNPNKQRKGLSQKHRAALQKLHDTLKAETVPGDGWVNFSDIQKDSALNAKSLGPPVPDPHFTPAPGGDYFKGITGLSSVR